MNKVRSVEVTRPPRTRNDFMLGSTLPLAILRAISEPSLGSSWVTVRRTMSPIGSNSNVTHVFFAMLAKFGASA